MVGDRDVHDDVQVAALARPPQVRGALAAQPDLGPRLRPRLYLHGLFALDGGHEDGRPEGRLRDPDARLEVQLRAVAAERRVRRAVHGHVQRAGRSAPWRRLALVREPELASLVDARGDRQLERPLALDAARAVARLAGR